MQNGDNTIEDLPLKVKLQITKNRIKEWYEYWNGEVYVAFSGGKDSTVLLHLVRSMYPEVQAAFCDTGLEYPEIREFVKTFNNVIWLKPKMNFKHVIEKYGYPVVSKMISITIRKLTTQNLSEKYRNKLLHGDNSGTSGKLSDKWMFLVNSPFKISEQCCDVMKKRPAHKFEKETGLKPIIGTMVEDSRLRKQSIERYGCNAFEMNHPQSRPLSLWVKKDIWAYIRSENIQYCKIYDGGRSYRVHVLHVRIAI